MTSVTDKDRFLPKPVLVPLPIRYPTPAIGRNEACPCGSGNKFKRCCRDKYTRKTA